MPSSSTHKQSLTDEKTHNTVWAVAFLFNLLGSLAGSIYISLDLDLSKLGGDDAGLKYIIYTLIGTAVCTAFLSMLWSVFWMLLIRRRSALVIHFSLATTVVFGAVVVGLSRETVGAVTFGALVLLEICLLGFVWIIRDRIPFAAALMNASVVCVQTYPMTGLIACMAVFVKVIVVSVYFVGAMSSLAVYESPLMFCYLVFATFWTSKVLQNLVHVVSSGVSGTFFFTSETRSSTSAAFRMAMTKSFGCICYASFIQITVLIPVYYVERIMHFSILFTCCTESLKRFIRVFSEYPLTYAAIYGSSYHTSSYKMQDVFESKGIELLVSDRLTRLATWIGELLGSFLCVFAGWQLASLSIYWIESAPVDRENYNGAVFIIIVGFFFTVLLSYSLIRIAFQPLNSGVAAFFVCWAQNQSSVALSRPEIYQSVLAASNGRLRKICTGASYV